MRRQVLTRAVEGIALALGAPVGWLVLRAAAGTPPLTALRADPQLYLYLLLPTMVVFTAFGSVLGLREARLQESNQQLGELSVTDELTGLKNVRYLRARLQEEHARAVRTGEPLAVAMIDLDRFKKVNDAYGHPAGDAALARVAEAINSAVRQGETVARVGGEEFAILMPGNDGPAARVAAERIRGAVSRVRSEAPGQQPLPLTASIGVASSHELPGADGPRLYQAADDMLYRAKRLGRNRVVVYRPPRHAMAV